MKIHIYKYLCIVSLIYFVSCLIYSSSIGPITNLFWFTGLFSGSIGGMLFLKISKTGGKFMLLISVPLLVLTFLSEIIIPYDLQRAAMNLDSKYLQKHVNSENVNVLLDNGETLFTYACKSRIRGRKFSFEKFNVKQAEIAEVLEVLIKAGADMEMANSYGETPLHIVAYRGMFLPAKVIVENGGDVLIKDKNNRTPLDHIFLGPPNPDTADSVVQTCKILLEKMPESQAILYHNKYYGKVLDALDFFKSENRKEAVYLYTELSNVFDPNHQTAG